MPTLMRLKPSLPSMRTVSAADFARVDFDGVFAAGDKLEMFAYHAEYAFDLVVAQESRRTAAEVQLRKLMPSTQMRGEQLHFFFKVFDVGIGAAFCLW